MAQATAAETTRPDRSTVLRGMSWVAVGHAASQASWFGSLILIAALVPPAAVGSVSVAMVAVQVAWLVVGSGTRGSFVVAEHVSRAQVRSALAINVGTGVAIGAGVTLAGDLVPDLLPGVDPGVMRVLAWSIVLYGFSIVPLALLQREMRFKQHGAANGLSAVIASVIAVGLAIAGAGVWALVVRQVLFQLLLAVLGWVLAWKILPRAGAADAGPRRLRRPPAARAFFALAVIAFVALNVDYVIVGRVAGVEEVGLYALAFTIAFAPMTQFAWQIGKVLFPTAARDGSSGNGGERAEKALMVTALVVLPAGPVLAALAPVLLPAVLGAQWAGMVVPFQILLAAGLVHALLAVLREFLLGTGSVGLCVRIETVWLAATVGLLVVLVRADGIVGAALTHAVLVVPLGAAYLLLGLPRLGSSPARLGRSLRPIVLTLLGQCAVLGVVVPALQAAGASADAAWACGAACATGTAVLLLARPAGPLTDARRLLGRPAAGGAPA